MEEHAMATGRKPLHSSPLPVARPWTPPDMDTDATPPVRLKSAAVNARHDALSDSGYFGGSSTQAPSNPGQDAWPPSPSASPILSPPYSLERKRSVGSRAAGDHGSQHNTANERPYTPTKTPVQHHAPQYPFTPDSTRMSAQRSQSSAATSPILSQAPWASPLSIDRTRTSPVQHALFSCLNNLERLISTNQPDPTQMEYIITQFEAMTSYLSAPEAQSKQLDEHLFSELEKVEGGAGDKFQSQALTKEEAEAYVGEVGAFIKGVYGHAAELRTRLDEVKQLNEIQMDIISDLRNALRKSRETQSKLQQELERQQQQQPRPVKHRKVFVKVEQPKRSWFWGSFADTLDELGDMLLDW